MNEIIQSKGKQLKTTRNYYLTDSPYDMLKLIFKTEIEAASKKEPSKIIKEKKRGTRQDAIFVDCLYLGSRNSTCYPPLKLAISKPSLAVKLTIPEPHPNGNRLDTDHREQIRITYCKLNRNKAIHVLNKEREWSRFNKCIRIILNGLSNEELNEKYPYITEEVIQKIKTTYESTFKEYEEYHSKINALKANLDTDIEELIKKIGGR